MTAGVGVSTAGGGARLGESWLALWPGARLRRAWVVEACAWGEARCGLDCSVGRFGGNAAC